MPRRVAGGTAIITAATIIRSTPLRLLPSRLEPRLRPSRLLVSLIQAILPHSALEPIQVCCEPTPRLGSDWAQALRISLRLTSRRPHFLGLAGLLVVADGCESPKSVLFALWAAAFASGKQGRVSCLTRPKIPADENRTPSGSEVPGNISRSMSIARMSAAVAPHLDSLPFKRPSSSIGTLAPAARRMETSTEPQCSRGVRHPLSA